MEECPDLKALRGYLTGGYAFNGNDADEIVAAMEESAKLKPQVDELRKHLRYVCNIAERLGPKAHNTHREEALQMLDGTLKDAEEVLTKTGKRVEHCKSPSCIGDLKCQCQCYTCLQLRG